MTRRISYPGRPDQEHLQEGYRDRIHADQFEHRAQQIAEPGIHERELGSVSKHRFLRQRFAETKGNSPRPARWYSRGTLASEL